MPPNNQSLTDEEFGNNEQTDTASEPEPEPEPEPDSRELRSDADSDPMRRQTDSNPTTSTESPPREDMQQSGPGPGSSPVGGGSVDDGSNGSGSSSDPSPREDIQDSGPGPGDSPSGGGSVDDSGSSGNQSGPSSPPEDIQDSGPGPGDSAVGGGDSVDDRSSAGQTGPSPPREDIQDAGPGAGDSSDPGAVEHDDQDRRPPSTPETTPYNDPSRFDEPAPEREFATNETAEEQRVEQAYAEQNDIDADQIDAYQGDEGGWFIRDDPEYTVDQLADEYGISEEGIDVEQSESGTLEFSINEQGVEQRFAAQDEDISADEVEATEQADGTITISPTEEAGEATLRELTDRANQSVSLGTTGLGTSGTSQSRTREQTERASESISLGTTGLGTSQGAGQPDEGELERGSTAETDTQIDQDIEDVQNFTTAQQSNLQRGEGTAAQERREAAEQRIRNELEAQGVDPDSVDVDVGVDDEGEMVADVSREEQFGDIDWSMGMGDPETDEVEQFVDETIGGQGTEFVQENLSDPLREWGESAKGADIPQELNERYGADGVGGGAPDTVGPGQAAGNLAIGAANIAESAPRLPAAALEGAEVGGYLLEGTAVSGGSREQFGERAGEVATAGAALAEQEVERIINNPEEAAGEALVGAGIGRAAGTVGRAATGERLANTLDTSAARQATSTYAPDAVSGASRGARSAVSDAASSTAAVGQSALRSGSSRTPDVDVRRDPDAPTLEIDPELRQRISDAASTPDFSTPSASELAGRARLASARAQQRLSSARARGEFDVSNATTRVRESVESRASDVRDTTGDLGNTARRAPSVAARNVAQEARRVRRRASSARAQAEFRASQAAEVVREPSTVTPDTDFSIDQAARSAGREFEARRRRTQLELTAARASVEERARTLADGVPSSRDVSDAAFRTRERLSQRATEARVGAELALRTQDAPGVDVDVDLPSPRQRIRDVSDAAYRTRERVSSRATSARVGAELALRTRGFDRPSFDNPLAGASDVTIRIGGGGDSTPDVDADEFVADGFDVDEVFDGADGEAGGASDGPDVVAGGSSSGQGGGAVQQLTARQHLDDADQSAPTQPVDQRAAQDPADASPMTSVAAGAGTMGITDPFGDIAGAEEAGAAIDEFDGPITDPAVGLGDEAGVADDVGRDTIDDLGVSDPVGIGGPDTDLVSRPVEDTVPDLTPRDDTTPTTATSTRQDTDLTPTERQTPRRTTRTPFDPEPPSSPRPRGVEPDRDPDDGGSRRRDVEGWAQREERELLNPFTGE